MKKVAKISLSFFLFCIMVSSLKAQTMMKSLPIGKAMAVQETLRKGKIGVPMIKVNGLLYVVDEDLLNLGMTIEEKEDHFCLKELQAEEETIDSFLPDETGQKIYSLTKPLYFNHKRSHILAIGRHYYVPVDLLKVKWQIDNHGQELIMKEKHANFYLSPLTISEQGVENKGENWLHLTCRHGYWNGAGFNFINEQITLAPKAQSLWQNDGEGIYAGTQLQEINGISIPVEGQTDFEGQQPFYEGYARAERLVHLEKVFPPFILVARMRYDIGNLKTNEEVALLRSEKRAYYWVKNEEGKKIQVPYGSVQILGEKGAALSKVTKELIEEFANLMEIQSETDFLVWTDVYRQKTYVLNRQDSKWYYLKSFICSTGRNTNPTPTGFYKVQYAIPYFGLGKGYRCKYALVFFRDYMYHSILFDKTGQYIKSGQYELGSKASHGCIRLSEEDSNWMYQHVPVKTTVWIR